MSPAQRDQSLVFNGEFRQAQQDMDFPDGWIRICGHRETSWEWRHSLPGYSQIVIGQLFGGRAGIIQTVGSTIYTGGARGWEISASLGSDQFPVDAYMYIYPGTGTGQFTAPWQFFLRPSRGSQLFTKCLHVPVNTRALRLEVGLVGRGTLFIHRIAMFRLEA